MSCAAYNFQIPGSRLELLARIAGANSRSSPHRRVRPEKAECKLMHRRMWQLVRRTAAAYIISSYDGVYPNRRFRVSWPIREVLAFGVVSSGMRVPDLWLAFQMATATLPGIQTL